MQPQSGIPVPARPAESITVVAGRVAKLQGCWALTETTSPVMYDE
jgi:hypothetical protein